MPRNAIVLPAGSGVLHIIESMSPARLSIAPQRRESGRTVCIDDFPEKALTMCGATIPMNPIGPQKAVTEPVIRQHDSIDKALVLPVFTPADSAYSSPKSIALRPLPTTAASTDPATRQHVIVPIPLHVLPLKLPAAQFQYIFSWLSLAWYSIIDVNALMTNPAMTPVMRSTDELRTREEIPRIIIDIINAPVAAAAVIPIADPVVNPATADAMAAPVPAPALIPRMCGSASGLRKSACICAPQIASPLPAMIAVRMRGIRICQIIVNAGLPSAAGPARRVLQMSLPERFADPVNKSIMARARKTAMPAIHRQVMRAWLLIRS